ncbi:MAG: glycerol kinase GlpK [Candidatus Obscuribacterales bacterium]|jgi:glycerol kinase|nr:glycerol kinase GlpK [Candidatus Obscuribacterales bacterium]
MKRYILSLDQGTTSSRAIIFDENGKDIACGQKEFQQFFPQPGWVEHDPREILQSQFECAKECLAKSKISPDEIACVAITNQRETTVVWDKKTGEPVYNAIVWQCRRTQDLANQLRAESEEFRLKTGLVPDAYFSGPKIAWILDNVKGARERAEKGELLFGTIDTWLIWNLTGGKTHATEASNASRTMLFNLHNCKWDEALLKRLNVPASMMPEVKPANADFGNTLQELIGVSAPIRGVLGDQQAALFGQACFSAGMAKCTYGTGGFLLVNIGETPELVPGLLSTVAWQLEKQKTVYAVEGAIFIAGAAIQWLRDGLNIIESSDQAEQIASSVESNEGVFFVPALVGMGSPWWNSDVRGTIVGLTRGTNRAHLVRAGLEAMAYQVKDVAMQMNKYNLPMKELRVDGGATRNNLMLQFQSDILGIKIVRSGQIEATAWGAAAVAAIGCGLVSDMKAIADRWIVDTIFDPKVDRADDYAGWQRALKGAFATAESCV